jgi:hypothetical protein
VPWPRMIAAVLPSAVPMALLAAGWTVDPGFAVVAVAAAAAAAIVVRQFVVGFGALLATVPLIAMIAYLSVSVALVIQTEALAGVAALGVLAFIGLAGADPVAAGRLLVGVMVPGLGLGLALSVSLLIPVARQSIGTAAALLVAALALLAWSILASAPEPTAAEAFPPSL